MKMLWKICALTADGEKRAGWIAADTLLEATKMAAKEGVELIDDPEEWKAGQRSQVFLQAQ